MGTELVTKIRGLRPLAGKGWVLLLALVVSFACTVVPQSAEAAVAALTGNTWRTTASTTAISSTAYFRGTTTVPGATNTYAIAAGSNRMLVVVLAVNTSVAQATLRPAVTYGGRALTVATTDEATSSRQHSWIFYLDEAGIAAATGTNLSFTYTGNAGLVYTGTMANAAVYTGVSGVITPTTFNSGATANTAIGPLTVPQVVVAGNLAIEVMNTLRTGSSTAATITYDTTPSAWTSALATTRTGTTPAAYAANLAIRTIATAGTHDSTHTASANVLDSMSAITLSAGGVTVANGSTVVAPTPGVYAGDTNVTVDSFTLAGSGTVTGITVTGNANATSARVSGFKIWKKVGANAAIYETGDTQIGSGVPNGATAVPVTLTAPQTVSATPANYVITFDISPTAIVNGTSITVSAAVTALAPAAVALADTATAATILATTTLGNGTSEPPAARLPKSSAATLIDAFTLKHNGTDITDDDDITNVTVVMTPAGISGGTGGTVPKFKLVEVVNSAGTTVYGSLSAPTNGIWNIPTLGLTAKSAETTYYIRVTTEDVITPSSNDPSGTPTGYYYPITATVTSVVHGKGNSKLILGDTSSAQLAIDVEKPNGPATATATTVSPADPVKGKINLIWDPVSDNNGGSMDPVKPVIIRRSVGDGTRPVAGCGGGDGSTDLSTVSSVTIDYVGRSVEDNGLIDTYPTRYYYRVCAKDAQGNVSDGAETYANASITNICNLPPTVTLKANDNRSLTQVIKSVDTTPFLLQVYNGDIGVCPDVTFTISLTDELNSADFSQKFGATEATAVGFPGTVTLGTGGAGASTGKAFNVYVSGLPTANQLELYKFTVTATSPGNSHGPAVKSEQVTGMLNDMPPIVHNSDNMGKFQYGKWGQTYTCATCHSNSTTNIKGVYEIISTPIGRRPVLFNTVSSVESVSTGVYGNDKRVVQRTSTNVCEVCHHNTRQHQYSASKVLSNVTQPNGTVTGIAGPGGDEGYNPEHHNSRDCVKCHTHNTAFRSIFGVCGDCHGYKATGYSPIDKGTMVKIPTNGLGQNPPNYGAHQRHFKAQITCEACHSSSNHALLTTTWNGDDALEMGFKINKDTFNGFNAFKNLTSGTFYGTDRLNSPYSWSVAAGTKLVKVGDYNNSCNTYCHGSWSAGNNAPIWVGDGQAKCGTCHNATPVNPPTTGSHAKHAAGSGAGLGITCNRCHGTYSNYSTSNAHINGNVQWAMPEFPTATYKGQNPGSTNDVAPSSPLSYGTCNNLYCHSNVRTDANNGVGGPTSWASPSWGGTAVCGSCHGGTQTDAIKITSGSHANHENATYAFDCHLCHQNGGTTSPLNHANGKIDFQFNGLAQNTQYSKGNSVTPGTTYGTCSTSDCHGRFNRQWGSPLTGTVTCEKCHGSATSAGGFYSTRGPGSTMSVYSAGVGVHDIHLQNLNSPRKATFNRFTSYAAGYTCNQCHNVPTSPFSAGHIDTALPAEVLFGNRSSIAKNGDSSYRNFSSASYNPSTGSCSSIWCHGGGMDSNSRRNAYAGSTPVISRTNPQWNVPYLTGNGASDCTKCHALPPQAPDASFTHFGKTLDTCASCHQHVGADGMSFKNKTLHADGKVDGGCTGCHGNPPINNIVGDKDGLAKPAQNALNGGAGAHAAHALLPEIGTKCNICHDGASGAMPSNELELGFNMFNGLVKTGTFTGYTNSVNGPKWKNSNATTTIVKSNVKAAVCSNLYCHGGGTTGIAQIGGGANTTPNWEGTVTCGDCHGTGNTDTTVPTAGSHLKHASADSGRGLACESCHGAVSENGTHVNGNVSWQLDHTLPSIGGGATYRNLSAGSIAGPVPRANAMDYGTCSTFYCHSNVTSVNGAGVPTTYGSPQWGYDNNKMTCASCHTNMATDTSVSATGSHIKHANTTGSGMGVPCGYCHQDAGAGSTKHADAAIYMNFTSYININTGSTYGANAVPFNKSAGTAAYTDCSNTFCHGTKASPVWGTTGPLKCNACHSASTKVSDAAWSGRHATHYNYTSLPTVYTDTVRDISDANSYRFNCAHCHDDNVAKHSLKPASANSAARVFFGISSATYSKRGVYAAGATANSKTDNGFRFTAGSCNTSYCHSNGRGGIPKVAFLNWTTTPAAAGTNCVFCHDGKVTSATVSSSLSGKHDMHMNSGKNGMIGATNSGFNCVECHAPTMNTTSNTTVTDKRKHVNTVVNYSGARAYKTGYVLGSGSCTTYCHSNGNPNAVVFVSMTGSKVWTGSKTITTCNQCHGRSNTYGYPDYANTSAGDANANLHSGHMAGQASTTACSDCHKRTVDAAVSNAFRPYSSQHLSGVTDINFNTAKAYVGTNAKAVKSGAQNLTVTCSSVVCHGQGAPVWGAATTANTCQKCHGDRNTTFTNFSAPQVAPGYNGTGTDTSMTKSLPTDPRVGAHQRHLATNAVSAPVKCNECHVVVTAIRSANHWNYSTATITFGTKAKSGSHNPTVSRTSGIMQCSNTYCHTGAYNSGLTSAPFWNMTGMVKETATTIDACTKCHAMPPQGYTNHPLPLSNISSVSTVYNRCSGCHNNLQPSGVTNVGNVFVNKSLHVDGNTDIGNMGCNSCHDYDTTGGGTAWGKTNYGGTALLEGRGAHAKHIQYLKARYNVNLLNTDSWSSPAFLRVCGTCHSINSAADHTMGTTTNPRSITFGDGVNNPRNFGGTPTYNGNSATSSSVNPKSCSNTDCHYRTSPVWSTF